MSDTTNTGLLVQVVGWFFVAWNGLLTLILGHQMKKVGEISKEREDHCIPRNECERTHKALNERIDRFENEMKTGITGVHQRLDKILGCGHIVGEK